MFFFLFVLNLGSTVYEWYQELPGETRGGGAGGSHRERKNKGNFVG